MTISTESSSLDVGMDPIDLEIPSDKDLLDRAPFDRAPESEALAKPFRLGIVGLGAAVGLFARLSAANGFGDLDSRRLMLAAALTSFVMGLGLVFTAGERDRFGPPLMWITAIASLAWGTLNWMSPPFDERVTVWSNPDQVVLAVLGVGNGLLLSGLIALALVRRGPTLTVAATMLAGVAALAANTLLLRNEWPAIIALGVGFFLVLLAWDRSPRREQRFAIPSDSPRTSRAALSFISVALCGTALQLWISRTDIPRSLPAVGVCVILIAAAFASLVRVRREIERRETTLSEWTSWMREIRTKDFRSEIETFDSAAAPITFDPRPPSGFDGEAPRKLSFPNLTVGEATDLHLDTSFDRDAALDSEAAALEPAATLSLPELLMPTADSAAPVELPRLDLPIADTPVVAAPAHPPTTPSGLPRIDLPRAQQEPAAQVPAAAGGAFSAMLAEIDTSPAGAPDVSDLTALERWLTSPAAASRTHSLLVAIEAMSLDEFESLPPEDAAVARDEIGSYLAETMPAADLVSYIDGPYFIVAHASMPVGELSELNKSVQATLRSTNGIHAFLRPGADASLDEIVDEAVIGILQARQLEAGSSR